MAFLALAVLWACLGEIDVVASAQGKVVPSGKTKVIQPSEVAVVKAIHVYDGQQVKAGDLLVELDGSQTTADVERLKSDLMAAQVDSARATVLLEAIEGGQEPASIARDYLRPTRSSNAPHRSGCKGSTWNYAAISIRRKPLSNSEVRKSRQPCP